MIATRWFPAEPHDGPSGFRHGAASRTAIVLLCLAVFFAVRLLGPLPAERLRDTAIVRAIDIALSLPRMAPERQSPAVVVIDVDDATISRYGRWPLPRRALAELVAMVKSQGPSSVGFAYVFTGAGADDESDRLLATSLAGASAVLGTAAMRTTRTNSMDDAIQSVPLRNADLSALAALPRFGGLIPIPTMFRNVSAGAGLLTIQLSHNGVPVRLPSLVRHDTGVVPSLPLEMLRVSLGAPAIGVTSSLFGLSEISIGERRIATDSNGMIWFGIDRAYPPRRVSALEVLDGRFDLEAFRSAHVLVGSTAAGLSSDYLAADGGALPGLDALAHGLAAMVTARTFHYPPMSMMLEILLAIAIALCLFVADAMLGPRAFVLMAGAGVAALWGGSVGAISGAGLIVDAGLLTVFLTVLSAALVLNTYRLSKREARATIAEKEREVSTLREDSARVAVAAANPRLSIALSHELRQPLAAASNYLGAIRRLAGRGPAEASGNLVSYANEASRQITSMTEIMNELAEIVRGDLTLMADAGLPEVALDAVNAAVSAASDPAVRLMTDIPEEFPAVLINRRQIYLVVNNLARNAIEAPRTGPYLDLALRLRVLDGEWVELSLSDNAAGIPEGKRERIFSRFESSKRTGSGVGLRLCRDIVEAHGGRLGFETATGKGTTFFLTLRRAAVAG